MAQRFEWDPKKNKHNIATHRVPFDEALTVFEDPLALTAPDSTHALEESRWATIGRTRLERLVVVFYTKRGDTIRLISARPPTRQERRAYEEETP